MNRHVNQNLILHNGDIHIFNDSFDVVNALAIRGNRVAAIGADENILSLAGAGTEIVNLEGKTVFPGLTDSHIHFRKYAQSHDQVKCETPTLDQCLNAVRSTAKGKANGTWILGHGWNQNQWVRFGNRTDLDGITSEHPIYLTAKSLHAGWANSIALQIAGLDKNSPNPPGGEIQLDSSGDPTGILFENAMQLVSQHIPSPTIDETAYEMIAAQTQLWSLGITSIHDFDGPHAFSAFQHLHNRGKLGLRVIKNIPVEYLSSALEIGLQPGFGHDLIRLGNIKLFSDGALGPHTAAMFDPYEGEEDNSGILLLDSEGITEVGKMAVEAGFGLCVHAIGDKANNAALNAFETILNYQENEPVLPIRHRIEHLQLLHPQDIPRVAQLGIVASMQPMHAISDMEMADRYWGERTRYAYAWRSVLDSGGILAFGSDAPVEEPNPFWGIHAAVTRHKNDGSPNADGWIPEERITLLEAFTAYTRGAAFASGQEIDVGRLDFGYFGDLVVFDTNPFEIEIDRLRDLKPIGTMVGGVWRVKSF